MLRKKRSQTKVVRFGFRPWEPKAGGFEINAVFAKRGEDLCYLYPVFIHRDDQLRRTEYLLDIRPGIGEVERVVFHHRIGDLELEKLPLKLPDTVAYLVEGVKMAATSLLGELKLVVANDNKMVYILASRAPADSSLVGLKPARLITVPELS